MLFRAMAAIGLAVGIISGSSAFAQATGADPYGDWTLSDGRLTVKIVSCHSNQVCANLIRLQEPNNGDGTPKLDLKNKTSINHKTVFGTQNPAFWVGAVSSWRSCLPSHVGCDSR